MIAVLYNHNMVNRFGSLSGFLGFRYGGCWAWVVERVLRVQSWVRAWDRGFRVQG